MSVGPFDMTKATSQAGSHRGKPRNNDGKKHCEMLRQIASNETAAVRLQDVHRANHGASEARQRWRLTRRVATACRKCGLSSSDRAGYETTRAAGFVGSPTARVLNQSIDPETAMWLSGVSDEIHERIARTGLCEPREPEATSPQLAEWITRYLEQRAPEIAAGSLQRIRQTGNRLEGHFGCARPIDSISAADAKAWRADMLIEGLAEATARLHCRNAKSIFNEAVEQELIEKSPMAKLKSGSVAANRDRFVTAEETQKLLEAAPTLEWRILIGLARLAGLRIPSESHILTWDKVDWEKRRLTVFAPKTGQTRVVPIVPELFELLSEAWDRAPDGATEILTMSRNNLHRNFTIIIERAGLTVWPGMWQSLRRSAETMFAMQYPQHVVSGWIGHSVAVSLKHYVQTPDSVFEAASGLPVLRAADSAAVTRRIDGNHSQLAETDERRNSSSAQNKSQQPVEVTGFSEMGGGGIEPPTPGFSILCSTN